MPFIMLECEVMLIMYRAILHDEEIYPDPLQFKPERFLEENGDRAQADPTVIGTFGFGRR